MTKKNIQTLLNLLAYPPHTLVDIGASGGLNQRWKPFLPLLRTVGFEPDQNEFLRLQNTPQQVWFDTAISEKKQKKTLYITKSQTNTSLLKPNLSLLNQFQWSPTEPQDNHSIVKEVEIDCDSLDNVLSSHQIHPDYLKIDTQGTELDILQGAVQSLKNHFFIVECEVEFAPIYQNQPLFSDVDLFMREHGFYLQDLGNFLSMKPRGLAGIGGAKGRLISADALYFKDLTHLNIEELNEKKIHSILLGYVAYGYPELGAQLLFKLKEKNKPIKNSELLIEILCRLKPTPSIYGSLAKRCGKFWYRYRQPKHC
ncbi:FkbM family methyltransferase, partial [bacterium]|nr:FkbM family methyltransferase [bacterium]